MKKLTLISFFILFVLTINAQQIIRFEDFDDKDDQVQKDDEKIQTIFNSLEIKRISGFGGPTMSYTSLNDEFAILMGGGGGLLLNNFFIGGYGEGVSNTINSTTNSPLRSITFGHGGFWLGYEIAPRRIIHPVISSRIGWGAVSAIDNSRNVRLTDNVMVFVPTVSAEINFTRFFKINIGAEYRQTIDLNSIEGLNNNDFSGPGVYVNFLFGWF